MEKVKIKNYPMFNPNPIVLVGADVNGTPNYATIGAFGVVCQGPIFYISLKDTHFTTIRVKENGYFSVNIPSADMIQKTDYCGLVSGFEVFFGEIVSTYVNENCLTGGVPDPLKVNPTLGMGFNYYQIGQPAGAVFQEGKKITF